MVEELIDPPPESQEQPVIDIYNNLALQYPDLGVTPVNSNDEIDIEQYKILALNDINAKRQDFENEFGFKVEPFVSIEDYEQRSPKVIEAAKKAYLETHPNKSIGDFQQWLAKNAEALGGTEPNQQQPIQPPEKPFNFNEALGNIPPVGGYGGDVPRETSGKVLEYKLGEAKRKELADAKQLQANAFRLLQNNQLSDDQLQVLNALQDNAYKGFEVPDKDKKYILKSEFYQKFGKPNDEELDALNTRASNIAEGNLLEAQQIGSQLKQIDKDIQENYTANGLPTPPELINQTLQLQSQWRDRIDKANLFSVASNKGMVENYNRQVEKGNLMGDFAVSTVAGLNNLGKSVINSLATLQPSDVLKFSGVDNPLQNDKFDKMFGYDKDKAKKWIQDFNTNNAKGFDHVMYDVMKLSTPEHREAQGKIMSAVLGIIELAPPMAIAMMSGNPYISYSVWAANSYGTRIEQMTKDPRWENASLNEIKMAALPASLAEAAVMEVGLKNVKQATGIGKGGLDQTTKIYNALRNATESIVPNSGLNGLQKSIIDGATRMTTGAITASGTGATVSMVDDIGKNLYNIAMGDVNNGLDIVKQEDGSYNIIDNSGKIIANEPTEERANNWKKRFEPVTPYQIVENGVNSAKDWALMGMIMSAPMTAHAILKGAKVDSRDFAFTKSLVEDGSRVNTLYANIKNDLATGKIDKVEAQDRITALKEFKNIADKIPSDLTPQNQRKAFDLLNNIKKLEAQKVGKAEGLTGSIDKQITELKTKLQEIGDAPQDRSKDDYSGEESFWAHTIREFDEGVNYNMKFENTSSDATPKNENNAEANEEGGAKPTPIKVKVLGKDVNMYNDYIPSKIEDIEADAMYSFNSDSKIGIPSLLHDITYANKSEVNGVKKENWHASISGEELIKLYPKEQPKGNIESKPNDNTNAEITNTESTSIDGQNKIQGQPETNIETVSNSTEAKNAEVVGEVKKEPKSLIQLESENKSTLPKIPTKNVFNNNVEVLPRDVVSKADKYMEEGESSKLPLEKIDVSKIVPTQKNLTVDNLKNTESVKSSKEDITLFKEGDKYYVLDGHHRIANEILKGNGEIEGRVFDNTKSEKSIEQPIADPTKEPLPFIQEVTGNKKAVTLSGNSEAKRQKLIANRVEKTTLSGAQKSESELAQKVKKFNDMTPSERVKNFRLLNEIKADANGRFKVINNGSKDKVEVKAKTKKGTYRNIQILTSDAGRRSIAPNGKALHERPQEFQQEFVKLMDLGLQFDFRNVEDNSQFKPSQEASAIADIYDGIPSEQAEIILNTVQKAIETNQIQLYDHILGEMAIPLDQAVKDIAIEQNAEDYKALSVENLEKYYKENVELQEQFEQIIQQEYENIANGVDETTATELNGESQTTDAKSDSKELPNEKANEKSQSQEGLEPPKPPIDKTTADSGKGDGNILGITHAANEVRRQERGGEEYQKDPQSFERWNNEAEQWLKDGGDVEALMDRLEKMELGRGIPIQVENAVRLIHMATVDAEIRKNPSNELIAKQKRYVDIGNIVNTALGRGLVSLKGEGRPLRSLSDFYTAKVNALFDGATGNLTEQQKRETEQAFNKIENADENASVALQELKDKFDKLKAELELLKLSKGTSTTRAKKTSEDFVRERKSIRESIASKWRNAGKDILSSDIPYRKQFAAIAPDVILLAKSYIEELSIKLEEVTLKKVVKKLHEELVQDIPEITEKDIHNIMAGEYNKKLPQRSKLASDMRDLVDEAKYVNKLEAILRGENPKTEKQKTVRNQKIADLQKRIKDLQKDLPKTDAELLQRLEGIKSRNEKAKDKLKERIAKKEFTTEKEIPFLEDPEVQRKFPKEHQKAVDAILAREDARHEFDIALMEDQKSRRGNIEKATDFLSKSAGTVKAIVTGIDDSAVAIQTYMATLLRPAVGAQALGLHVSHALSQKRFDRWFTLLHNSSDFKLMQDAGLHVTDPKSLHESKKDEIFNNRFDGTIKIKGKEYQLIGAPLKPFERAFNTLGNASRVLAFRAKANQYIRDGYTFKSHPELFKSLAERLNTQTGRGKQNEYIQKASKVVTMGIWSPGLMAAKFNMLGVSDLASLAMSKAGTKGYYRQLHPLERIEAIKDVVDFSTAVLAISYGAALAFGGTVDDDPLSSTYLDVKFDDGKSYNFSGGFSSYIRTIAQFAKGAKIKDGKKTDVNRLDIAGRFARGKMPPISAAIANTMTGKDFMGKETSALNEAKNLLTPISVKGIYKQIQRDGTESLFTQGIPTFFGFNIKDQKDFEKESPYTKDVKNRPALKYFVDKKITLPYKALDEVEIKDIPTKTNKKVSDYSLPLQKLYTSTHLRIFEKNLQKVINRGYVYKQEGYSGNISNQYTKDGVKRNKVLLSKLTDKELEEVLSNAMTSATDLAKKKVFTRSAQLSDKK